MILVKLYNLIQLQNLILFLNLHKQSKRKLNKNPPAVLVFVSKDTSPVAFAEKIVKEFSMISSDCRVAVMHEFIGDRDARGHFLARMRRGEDVLATQTVDAAITTTNGRPTRVPADFVAAIGEFRDGGRSRP